MQKKSSSQSGIFNLRVVTAVAFCSLAASLGWVGWAASPRAGVIAQPATSGSAANAASQQALARLQAARRTEISTEVSPQTGNYTFVKAATGNVLVADKPSEDSEVRARAFLANNGALVGINNTERSILTRGGAAAVGSNLQLARKETDSIGLTHVKLDQFYQGLRVLGAQLIVHMNNKGITGVNGDYVADIAVSPTPELPEDAALQVALGAARKTAGGSDVKIDKFDMGVYPLGLLEGGGRVQSRLAYAVEVSGKDLREQIWVDANNGEILNRISLRPDALFRMAYSPQYDPANPNMFVLRKEGDPPVSPVPGVNSPIDNLFDFTGFAYNFYVSAFGRDSYDALGAIMRTVLLVNEACPNAYWNGTTTNYCPAFDEDDVVCHEWSHAYTEYTHGLIYSYQSGALNEAYSDIFGETIDLIDGVDGSGGNDNVNHAQYGDNGTGVITKTGGGERFQLGEDFQGLNQPAVGILRDMYTPTAFGNPDKVSASQYSCGSGDGGGVHNNSGVPNHAYSLAVDGGTFNGQTITGIGLTKAAAIWFRAESVYQTPSTNFAQHQAAIETSCNDLINQNIYVLKSNTTARTVSAEKISAQTCTEVHKAMLAVEMNSPIPCNFPPLLDPLTPAICDNAQTIYSENWETGTLDGWTLASVGEKNNAAGVIVANPDWPGTNWVVRGSLPDGHVGKAAFALDSTGGSCGAGGDISGHFAIISPAIVVPAGANNLKASFDHWVQTETGADGGNLFVKVNGGNYTLVPQANYIFNAPNAQLIPAVNPGGSANTNPKAGEFAWTGSNQLNGSGSWGTTVVDLSTIAHPGDTIQLKYDFGQDGCGGGTGWFVDNVKVYNCPILQGPILSIGSDYENPDTNGSYTLNWTRPPGASGPDVLQVSQTACSPLLSDDASSLGQWTAANSGIGSATWTTSSAKPQHTGNSAFWASTNEAFSGDATLTFNNPIHIPASGITTLKFSQFYFNEDDDKGYVEVSTNNGATWTPIYSNARSQGDLPDAGATAFANENLTPQQLDLTIYSGQTIRLRFRYSQGPLDYFLFVTYGWYVDDISISNESWLDVANLSTGTSFTEHKPTGSYCYRVRTTYPVGTDAIESLFSNVVNVSVGPGIPKIVSRKAHGPAAHEVDLPLTGTAGIECRRGGGANADTHQVAFHFAQVPTFNGASVTPGPGKTAQIQSTSVSGTEILVNLINVSDAQTLTINLSGVNAGAGTTNISAKMSILSGDTNGDGSVNSADISQTKSQSGAAVTNSNFREDVNADGSLNSADISLVKSKSGTALP